MRISLWQSIIIIACVILVLVFYCARNNLQQDWDDLVETVSISARNFFYPFNPERAKFVSSFEKEEKLKSSIGEPFKSFNQSDWDTFWEVLYGAYPLDYSENSRLPAKVRQLTYSEMEAKLKELYPDPFSYFQDEHWRQFWQVVFGKKTGRQ